MKINLNIINILIIWVVSQTMLFSVDENIEDIINNTIDTSVNNATKDNEKADKNDVKKAVTNAVENGVSTGMSSAIWIDICPSCLGCTSIKSKIEKAAEDIDKRHGKLEDNVKKEYEDRVIPLLKIITQAQDELTKEVARIAALEKVANTDDKKLLFMLKKNFEIYSIELGVK